MWRNINWSSKCGTRRRCLKAQCLVRDAQTSLFLSCHHRGGPIQPSFGRLSLWGYAQWGTPLKSWFHFYLLSERAPHLKKQGECEKENFIKSINILLNIQLYNHIILIIFIIIPSKLGYSNFHSPFPLFFLNRYSSHGTFLDQSSIWFPLLHVVFDSSLLQTPVSVFK